MQRMFQTLLVLFGVVVIGIALAHLAIGAGAIIGGGDVNPTVDGEDRFFAGMFLCYGVALLWCAKDVQRKRSCINFLAVAFFIGGIGRLLAVVLVGARHPSYMAMLVLELALPALMVLVAGRIEELSRTAD